MKLWKKRKDIHVLHCLIYGFAKHFVIYAGIIAAAMAAVSLFLYCWEDTASASLTLNYEEAAKGLYPNSTRFSISSIKSPAVMKRAIEMAGLENVITPEQLSANITVSDMEVGGLKDNPEDNYRIATSYSVTYKKNPEIKRSDAGDMLSIIMQAYKEEFFENYAYGEAVLTCEIEDYESLEYLEIAELFKREGDKIYRYLNSRMGENGTFRSERTQETFSSLKKRANNFLNIDLEKYSAYVKQSGLSKDRSSYISKLEYQNQLLDITCRKLTEGYNIRLSAINLFDSAMTAVMLVPTVDTNLEFYMSKTKSALDYQAEDAKLFGSSAKDYEEMMNQNQQVMDMLSLYGGSSAAVEKAEEMIEGMRDELEDIAEKTVVTNQDYIKYKVKNYLSIFYEEKSLSDMGKNIKWALLSGGIAACLIGFWILISESRRKEEQ